MKLLVRACQLQPLRKCWLPWWGQAKAALLNGRINGLGNCPGASVSLQLGAALLLSSPDSLASSLLPARPLPRLTCQMANPAQAQLSLPQSLALAHYWLSFCVAVIQLFCSLLPKRISTKKKPICLKALAQGTATDHCTIFTYSCSGIKSH